MNSSARTIELRAPLSGQLLAIEHVPDPVFAQKMVGDGVSIDPTSQTLVAPCDGTVVQVHSAGHAVTLVTSGGIEVMIHVGLDTVNLKGQGFSPKVKAGAVVTTGTELIAFDADYIATHARSLLTQIVITNMDRVEHLLARTGLVTAGLDPILELTLTEPLATDRTEAGEAVVSAPILVLNPTGFHARPAAVLASFAKKFKSDIQVQRDGVKANAKSLTAIMRLEVGHGDKVSLIATGEDAKEAVAELTRAIHNGLGDEGTAPAPAPASMILSTAASPAPRPRSTDPNLMVGVASSDGIAVGRLYRLRRKEIVLVENATDAFVERELLERCLGEAKLQLDALQARLQIEASPQKAAIFAAHAEMLDDPDLMDIAKSAIAKGKSAAFAWQSAFRVHAATLAALKNPLLAARANDVTDVGERVLRMLTGAEAEPFAVPNGTILVAEDLTPSDVAELDRTRVVGFCTTTGGATSHVSILARARDVPAVAGIDPRALDLPDGAMVVLDGGKGTLRLNPSAEEIEQVAKEQASVTARRRGDLQAAMDPAVTMDGHAVEVVANLGTEKDAQAAVAAGAEGVGLLRSEFLFMGRAQAPTENEQTDIYTQIAVALGPARRLIIRTLDVGGDKPLAYLPLQKEDNPFLGERGLRVALDRPEIFRTQARAILRASRAGKVQMMFPMVTTLPEWRAAKALVEEERVKLGVTAIPIGIMVEVPAAALMAEQFAREVDFFSVGTNDLTQYTLAMDRGHPKLAPQCDGLNPAVLFLISHLVEAAHRHKRPVGVCGAIAGDPKAVPLLVGMGVDELSVSVPVIPSIKAQIRALRLKDCQKLAQTALNMDTAAAVRAL